MSTLESNGATSRTSITFIVIILVIITTVPVVIFVLEPQENDSKVRSSNVATKASFSCDQEETASILGYVVLNYDFLLSSVCRQHLPWMRDETRHIGTAGNESFRVVSAAKGCDLQQTEKDLKLLLNLASLASDDCLKYGPFFVCHYFYTPCANDTTRAFHFPTREECLAVKQDYCQMEWVSLDDYLRSSDHCIGLSECERLPIYQTVPDTAVPTTSSRATSSSISRVENFSRSTAMLTTSPTPMTPCIASSSVNSGRPISTFQVEVTVNDTHPPCKSPLVQSASKLSRCSPPCPADEWMLTKDGDVVLNIIFYLFFLVWYTCIFAIFYTWARIKELRKFPQISTLLVAVFYLISVLSITVSFLVGRRAAFCTHDDIFNTWDYPTKYCIAQGATFHFGYLAALLWLCFSVFNVVEPVYSSTVADSWLKHSPRKVLTVEIALSIAIPLAIVTVVLFTSSYRSESLLILCVPPRQNYNVTFYSYTLPTQIMAVAISTMAILVIKRMKQKSNFRKLVLPIGNQKAVKAEVAVTRHFLVLITGTPLLFLTAFTLLEAYVKFWIEKFKSEIVHHVICHQTEDNDDCTVLTNRAGYAAVYAIVIICFISNAVMLLVYSLSLRKARELWISHIRGLMEAKKVLSAEAETPGRRCSRTTDMARRIANVMIMPDICLCVHQLTL